MLFFFHAWCSFTNTLHFHASCLWNQHFQYSHPGRFPIKRIQHAFWHQRYLRTTTTNSRTRTPRLPAMTIWPNGPAIFNFPFHSFSYSRLLHLCQSLRYHVLHVSPQCPCPHLSLMIFSTASSMSHWLQCLYLYYILFSLFYTCRRICFPCMTYIMI